MPHAVVATAYGTTADVIDVIDVESGDPGPGEVRIAVRAAAINPFDAKIAAGALGTDPSTLPRRLGSEASGVVVAVGEGATGLEGEALAVGDEVFGTGIKGAQAAELTVPAGILLRKPASLSFEEAAGLLSVGTTAVHALEAVGVGAGDVVLVHGAAGSVGNLVAQLALLRGARVIGTAAPSRHAALRDAGIAPVAYGPGLADRIRAAAPDGITAAIDTVGTDEALETSLQFVQPQRVVTIVNFGPALAAGAKAIGAGPGAERGTEIRAAARLTLAGLAARGEITVPVSRALPIAEAREGYRLVMDGHAGGKVVLTD
jgi:NADPH:quinone reductase-like Zn-dependent oxidoreductase